ncbi:hypothetical protein [Actinoplanes sp. NPDC051859]|uniref:hypothetical protein n=1 Tax=Actinoplanes sp. NPDC051859 TaxID=3363909 RepID=UPI0037904BE4
MRYLRWLYRRVRPDRSRDTLAAEAAECAAARERLLDYARQENVDRWNAPTAAYRALMTRGQEYRGRGRTS